MSPSLIVLATPLEASSHFLALPPPLFPSEIIPYYPFIPINQSNAYFEMYIYNMKIKPLRRRVCPSVVFATKTRF